MSMVYLLKTAAGWAKARRGTLLYFLLFCGLLFVVYGLYGLPWGAAGYAVLLGFVLGLVFACIDIVRTAARRHETQRMVGRFPIGVLPTAKSPVEQEQQRVIAALEEERARLAEESALRQKEAQQYYTLWVHQIKTPIAALDLLLQGQEGTFAPGVYAAVQSEVHRIEQYAGMALQYQRLASFNTDLVLQQHTVQQLVAKALKNSAPLFIGKPIRLELEELEHSLVTDEKWFVFLLEQVLGNAAKYTREGSVRVYMQRETLCVEDTGIGIAPEDLPRVTERGYTGATGRQDERSTGLGLYLCHEIAARLGIGFSVQSVLGQGTTVRLNLTQAQLELD